MEKWRLRGYLWVILLACVVPMEAQMSTATISGTVTDSTGAVLPGAKLTILNEDTGTSRLVNTDAAGRYSAPSLSLGNYRVTASADGFQSQSRTGIVLTVGREATVPFQLSLGAVSQAVEVTGEAPLVQTTESTVSYLVGDQTVRDLPLNGRDMTQLILLNPGVSQAENSGSANAYDGWGKKISISGMRNEDNAYFLDGSYIADFSRRIPAGPSGSLMGVETIREFQVLTSSFGAQYGRALGGVFNAVSKSGTNEWHGDAYEFLRNSAMDAARWEDNALGGGIKPPFRRNQFGATLGGPLRKDKLFFFASYEGTRQSLTTTHTANVPDLAGRQGNLPGRTVPVSPLIVPFLNLYPAPSPQGRNFGDGTAQFIFAATQGIQDNFGLFRLDDQISTSDSLFARFTASNSAKQDVGNFPQYGSLAFLGTDLFTISETHVVSSRMLNASRFSFNRVVPIDKGTYPQVPAAAVSVPGQANAGILQGSLTSLEGLRKPRDSWVTNRFDFQDDVNLAIGNHSMQFGGLLERMQFNMDQPNAPFGEWTFPSLDSLLQAAPSNYRGTPPQAGNSVRGWRQMFFALYLQDDWRVTPKLTLNLGLRWEPYTVPTEVNGLIANVRHYGPDAIPTLGGPFWLNKSWRDFGPRFGLAWNPFAGGKTSVRGGVGYYFIPNDPTQYYILATRLGPLFPEYNVPLSQPTRFPNALSQIAVSTISSLGSGSGVPFDNNRSQRALQYNVNVQRQLGASTVLSLAFNGTRGIDEVCLCNVNAPVATFDGVSMAVAPDAKVVNSKFAVFTYYANSANSWYNAGSVTLQQRFTSGLQAQVSYTFSKGISQADSTSVTDPTGSGTGGAINGHDLNVSKGLSGYNVANKLSVNYSYDLPFGKNTTGVVGGLISGWQLNGIITAQDGQPFDVTNAAGATSAFLTSLGYSLTNQPGVRPNVVVPFAGKIVQGGPNQYFNPLAFSMPTSPFELGNVGRNILVGPGLASWDFGLTKNTNVTEKIRLQFRAELFNLLNRPNYATPTSSIFTSGGRRLGNAGTITRTVTTSRQIQFGLKLFF